jgi:type I restriction enzyme, R subunit
VEKLNELFGAEITEEDKVMFAVHITEKLRANDTVMAQVQNNPKEQALEADLPDAAAEAIIEAMTSHGEMANRLLSEPQAMNAFVGLLYDLLKRADRSGLFGGDNGDQRY